MGIYDIKVQRNNKSLFYNTITKEYNTSLKNDEGDVETVVEKEMREYLFYRQYFNQSAMSIMLISSFGCNLTCPYCFEKDYEPRKRSDNYFLVIKRMIEKKMKQYPAGIHINFFGGEPLIWKDEIFQLIFEMIDLYGEKITTSFVTNGTLIESDDIQKLKKANCKYIQITLDGCRREHDSSRKTKSGEGTFDGLLAVLDDLAEEIGDTTSVNVRVNLSDCDITELERDLECIPENVRPKLHLMPRVIFNTERYHHNNKNSYENIEPYYELFSKMGFSMLSSTNSKVPCEAGGDKNSFYVLPDLSVWKCVNDINVEEACIGRIQKDGDIKYNYCNLAHWFKLANPFNDEKCCECGVEPECGGGCILNRIKNGQRKCRFSGETDLPEFYGTKRNTYS